MRRIFSKGVMIAALVLASTTVRGDWKTNLLYRTSSEGMPYRLFVPWGYDPANAYPAVLYLHSGGSEGTNNESHLQYELAMTNFMAAGAFLVCPQATNEYGWTVQQEVDRAHICLVEVQTNYNINSRRLYLAGVSRGGHGTWCMAATYTNTFAAINPMAAWGDGWTSSPSLWAPHLIHTPAWAMHSLDDTVIPWECDQHMVDEIGLAITNAGGSVNTNLLKLSLFPAAGHGQVCDRGYSETDIVAWLFSKELRRTEGSVFMSR